MSVRERNQQHPPQPKKQRVDAQGNDKRRLFVKSGTATMCLAKGLTKQACDLVASEIERLIKNAGGELACGWLKWK